jgi:hypothetical protein
MKPGLRYLCITVGFLTVAALSGFTALALPGATPEIGPEPASWGPAAGSAAMPGIEPDAPVPLPLRSDTLTTLHGVFTEDQARSGRRVYDTECALCHGPREFSGRVFQITWTGQPLSSLFRHISLSMPLDNPGGLDREKYVAVLAYILELNGYPAGEMELPETIDEMGEIRMERLPGSTH